MKQFRSYMFNYWWPVSIAVGVLAPGISVAASKVRLTALAQGACEAQARAVFKKKAVEMELALISGALNDIEHSSARESLQVRLRRESADCSKGIASRSSAAETPTANF